MLSKSVGRCVKMEEGLHQDCNESQWTTARANTRRVHLARGVAAVRTDKRTAIHDADALPLSVLDVDTGNGQPSHSQYPTKPSE